MDKLRHLNFNQPAPDLILVDVAGKPVQLSSLWIKKPLLLAFTRHFGCTQCKEMLDELVQGKERIEAAGLDIAVITQGKPESTAILGIGTRYRVRCIERSAYGGEACRTTRRFGGGACLTENHPVYPESEGLLCHGFGNGSFPRRRYSGENPAWQRMVVLRS